VMYFLKMKAWLLFLFSFGIPFILMLINIIIAIIIGKPLLIFISDNILLLLSLIVFMSWIWAIGTRIDKKIPEDLRMKPGLFKFCVIYSIIYMLIFSAFALLLVAEIINPGLNFIIIIPFHLLAMFSTLYCDYYIAKNIVMAEKKERVGISSYLPYFILMWFYPIGIWFIQPKVNRIFANTDKSQGLAFLLSL